MYIGTHAAYTYTGPDLYVMIEGWIECVGGRDG